MGVYIKGMEMPKHCAGCPIERLDNYGDEIAFYCLLSGRDTKQVRAKCRREDCPLLPVHDHGDLIDRKALLADTTDMIHSMMVFGGARVYTSDAIINATVIIPADKEGVS